MQSEQRIMPTIEGEEAFDRSALARLCDQLQPYSERVSAVRIGGNDILALLGIRRSRYRTAYDGPLGNVIRDIAGTFIPSGFSVASPVLKHFSADRKRDVSGKSGSVCVEQGGRRISQKKIQTQT